MFRQIRVSDVQLQGWWHLRFQLLMADPGIDAAAMLRVRIAALPDERWKAFLEGDTVLARSAGNFQNQSAGWKLCRQHIPDRDPVALRRRKAQAFIAEAGIHQISGVGLD